MGGIESLDVFSCPPQANGMNVLFILCDDLNTAIEGMGRHPFAPTPNLKRLMDDGVRFTNAHANCPISLPSRNSLFSGIYPHGTGHFTLWDHWRSCTPIVTTGGGRQLPGFGRALLNDAVMMPSHFKRNGYGVFGAGKTFHEGKVDEGWWTDYRGGPDYGPTLWDAPPDDRLTHLFEGDPLEAYAHRYAGLDRFFLKGRDFHFYPIDMSRGPLDEVFGDPRRKGLLREGRVFRYVNDRDRDLLPDEETINYGIDVLRRDHGAPFFLALGLMKPHTPLNAPREYFERFPLDKIPLPPQRSGDIEDCARALVENCPYGFLMYDLITKEGETGLRKWLQAYLACVSFMDDQVGRLLDALERSPYAEDTLVVFSSDNGYHMGEKNYLFKNSLWIEGDGIPLIIRGPGVTRGASCATPVSLIDLYPTLNDYTGLPNHPNADGNGYRLDGHSLRPLLEAPHQGQWEGPPVALTSVRGNTGIHHSVISATHRYTLCQNGEEELYDHRADPHEWHNLAADPQYARCKAELREEWMKLVFYETRRA